MMFNKNFRQFYLMAGGPEVFFHNTWALQNYLDSEEGKEIIRKYETIQWALDFTEQYEKKHKISVRYF